MYNKIDDLIHCAIKTHNTVRLNVLRLMKSEFVNFMKDNELTELAELKIIQKMINQRKESIKEYMKANRNDLVAKENAEIVILNEFLPPMASDEEIDACVTKAVIDIEKDHPVTIKDMKNIMSIVKKTYPLIDGKKVSAIVNKFINH